MNPAEEAVRDEIDRRGSVGYDTLVDLALYHPLGGFYASGGQAGRRGDFITSPTVGPLFGAVVAGALDRWWDEMGRPQRYQVVEVGAGPGSLAASVVAAQPRCAAGLSYTMVERSSAQRRLHRLPQTGGVEVLSVPELPVRTATGGPVVVLANELLDNLPFRLVELTGDGWHEVRVHLQGDELVEVLQPFDGAVPAERAAPGPGSRVPLQLAAGCWLGDALALAGPGGRVVVFDYASTSQQMAGRPWRDWVRTYRGHRRGGHPLEHVGEQDITCEVAVDQLPVVPTVEVSQAEWLAAHGIEDLVDEGRRGWHDRAAAGDLAAVRARSRVREAEALLDPSGLGGFTVLEWVVR